MKKFLFGIVFLLIISGCSFENKMSDQTVAVENKPIKKEEVIEYSELEYTDIFKVGDIINIENTNYLSSYAIPGRWKHTVFYIGSYQQFLAFFKPEDKYYHEIIKHYQTQDEVLVLDSNSSGVKVRTFDQMANLKEEKVGKSFEYSTRENFLNRTPMAQGLRSTIDK